MTVGRGGLQTVPSASGIVLAGGRSLRFGRNKLAEPVGDGPLLDRPIRALAPLVREIVVALSPSGEPPLQPNGLEGDVEVRIARDAEEGGGPLVGLLTGLEHVTEPCVLVVAGDMPSLVPDVLRALLLALSASGADAQGSALEARGRVEPLPLALRTGAATHAVRRLVADGERRLGALLDAIPLRTLAEEEWRPLDPTSATLMDVDVPSDLDRLT